jgi:hypothetical protein
MPSTKPLKNIQNGHIWFLSAGIPNKNVRLRPKNETISAEIPRKGN